MTDDSLNPRRVSSIPGHIAVTSSTAASAVAVLHDSLLWLESLIQQVSLLFSATLLMLVLCWSLYCFWRSCRCWRLLLLSPPRMLSSLLVLLLLPAGVFTFATDIAVAGNISVICWCFCCLPCCCVRPYRCFNSNSTVLCVLGENAKLTPLSLWDSTLQRQFRLYIPFLGIARSQPQFPHSCVWERFIYSQDRSTYFLQQKRQTHPGWEYMIRSQTHECGNWDWDPDIPFLGLFVSDFRHFVFAVMHTVKIALSILSQYARYSIFMWDIRPDWHL